MLSQHQLYCRDYYQKHRQILLLKSKQHYERNRERLRDCYRERRRTYYWRYRDKVLLRGREHYQKNKVKYSAKMKAWYHLPITNKCEKCGSKENLERHHPDYNKPLEIETLCRICHVRLHVNLRELEDEDR